RGNRRGEALRERLEPRYEITGQRRRAWNQRDRANHEAARFEARAIVVDRREIPRIATCRVDAARGQRRLEGGEHRRRVAVAAALGDEAAARLQRRVDAGDYLVRTGQPMQ